MLRRGSEDEGRDLDVEIADPEEDDDEPRIRCPKCRWQPRHDSLWSCTCLHTWNTFDTGGRCPACGFRWQDTMCLACHRWSKHRDWYAEGGER